MAAADKGKPPSCRRSETAGRCRRAERENSAATLPAADPAAAQKKHPCPDCGFCQWCSDDRCRLCLAGKTARGRKLSLQEQIELYESLNRSGEEGLPGGSTDGDRRE